MIDRFPALAFPTRSELYSETKRWRDLSSKGYDIPVHSVVWIKVEKDLWWPATVVSKESNSPKSVFCFVKYLSSKSWEVVADESQR